MTINLPIEKVSHENPLLGIHKMILSRYSKNGEHLPGADETNTIALDILKSID